MDFWNSKARKNNLMFSGKQWDGYSRVTQGSEAQENRNDRYKWRFANTSVLVYGLWLQNSYRILCVGRCLFKITLQFYRVHIRVKPSECNMRRLMYKTKPQCQSFPNTIWLSNKRIQLTVLHVACLSSTVSSHNRNANGEPLK